MKSSARQAKTRLDWSARALLIALAVACAAGSVRAAEPLENFMPDGCTLCVAVRNVPDLVKEAKASPLARMASEPAMQPLLDEVAEGLDDFREQTVGVLGVTPKDLLTMLGGQVCLGVLPRGDRDGHWLLLADVSGNPELAATVLQNILRHQREQGTYDIVAEEFRGHTVYRIQPIVEEKAAEGADDAAAADDAGDDGDDDVEGAEDFPWNVEAEKRTENPGFITFAEGILAIASSPDRTLLEKHLVLRAGETLPTVGSSDRYRSVQPSLGEAPDVVAFVDIRAAIEEAGEEAGKALGASAPLALGLGLDLQPEGAAVQGLLLAPRPREGFMRAFAPQGGTVMPPACADADTAMLMGAHFSVPVLWEEIKATMQREDPEAYMRLEQGLKGIPVDVENGIISALGHRVFFYMPAPVSTEDDAGTTQWALMADLRDAAAFGTAWKQVLMMVPPMIRVDTIDFMGVSIQQFSLAMNMPNAGTRTPQPCVAVMADKLVLASRLDAAKSVVKNDARQASPLLDEPGFQQLLGRTMDDPDVLFYTSGKALSKLVKANIEARKRMWGEEFDAGDDEEIGPDEIPWDVLEKYASSSIQTAKWTDEGLLIKLWSPKPSDAE